MFHDRPHQGYIYRLITLGSMLTLLGVLGCMTQVQPNSPITSQTESLSTPGLPPDDVTADANAITTASHYQKTTIVTNLEHPWGMAWLPDGAILITERPGRLRIVRQGMLDPTPIAGVPEVFAENQGGLLDISLHPRFTENRFVYFTYSHGNDVANRTRVARAVFDGKTLRNWQVIFEVSPVKPRGQHFGARMIWLPDETLLISIGDGGNPPLELDGELIRQQAQNLNSHLGKIVRLKDDGSIPSDNPFADSKEKTKAAIWTYGHRNIQGLAFDPITNRVWATEHGSRGGDEVNLIVAGKNYGWPVVTHSREYSGGLISPETSLPGIVDPKLIWTPSIAPSGLTLYRGDRSIGLQGHLLAGGLVSQDIRRIELDEAGNIVQQESIPIGQRVRDIRQGPDGLLYVLTDEPNGHLIRLELLDKTKK
jgi:glucose/arabinose dehydrogenase